MILDNHGDISYVQGSGSKPYTLKNVNGVLSCDCPAWRNQRAPTLQRTCKHLKSLRGAQVETARITKASGAGTPSTTPKPATGCSCERGSTCDISHDPATCPCTQCTTAEAASTASTTWTLSKDPASYIPPSALDRQVIEAQEEARIGRKLRQDEKTKLFGPPVLLAHAYEDYQDSVNPTGYLLSEKLDGVRAFWTGEHFVSRQGNIFQAPDWFKARLPKHPLDGELWIGRRCFQQTISVVTSGDSGERWKDVTYAVFDAPHLTGSFEERSKFLQEWFSRENPPHVRVLDHYVCQGHDHLKQALDKLVALGAEGVMIRKPGSVYETRRSQTILKVKPWNDDEAEVVGYEAGKSSNKGLTGGVILKMPDGKTFHIGSLTAAQRRNPPPIGTIVTYRYMDKTDDGIPKGASIVCIRNYE